jgi:hypothetical protein
MNRNLRLILLKQLVNIPLRLVDHLLPEPESSKFPQTQMLQQIYQQMFKVYRLDCLQLTFSKGRDPKNLPDGNFERFLNVTQKILVSLSEDDPYYRKWVGLAMILAAQQWESRPKDPRRLKRLIKEQWHMDIDCLSDGLILSNVDDFAEDALCDYWGNLARMEVRDSLASLDQTFGGININ